MSQVPTARETGFENDEDFARHLDQQDPLREQRERFLHPSRDGSPARKRAT